MLYPGNGTLLDTASARTVSTGWSGMGALIRIGDLDRDGREDVVARENATGDLWFYPGTGSGLGTRKRIGTGGWNGMRELTAIGDFNRAGHPDLTAVQTSTGYVFLYPGNGSTLQARVRIATGFTGRTPMA
ncbi:VCBS repeat-containing protein [Actinoplanes sp. NPDC049118]|uniref:FG-GAP repeat domain-containing protein n=1 Tax=Actinoplanes sp. NPDC049118 TaxID=3155769 RepID=UPI0033E3BA63